jgi:hypothetical protein
MQFSHFTLRSSLALLLVAAATLPGRAVEPDRHLPADAEAVVVVNVQQIVGSAALHIYGLESIQRHMAANDEIKRFCEATGLDPLKDIHQIVVGAKFSGPSDHKYVSIVHGNFDLERIHDVITVESKTRPDDLKIEKKGAIRLYEVHMRGSKEKPYYAAFADRNTLILSKSAEETLTAINGQTGVSAALRQALAKFSGTESIYGALAITNDVRKIFKTNAAMQGLINQIQNMTTSFEFNNDCKIHFALQTPDAKSAESMKSILANTKPFLEELATTQTEKLGPAVMEIVRGFTVNSDSNNAVTINITVTEAMLKQFSDNAKRPNKN